MRVSNTRTQKTTLVLFARQRQLLSLLDAFGGSTGNVDFQKLLFLYCQEPGGAAEKVVDRLRVAKEFEGALAEAAAIRLVRDDGLARSGR